MYKKDEFPLINAGALLYEDVKSVVFCGPLPCSCRSLPNKTYKLSYKLHGWVCMITQARNKVSELNSVLLTEYMLMLRGG